MLSRYAVYAVNVLSLMILSRLFSPQDFGTVAAISVFFVFFQLIGEAGLGPAIINMEKPRTEDRDGLFGLTLLAGIFLVMLFISLTPVFLFFYSLPRIDEIIPYIAIGLFFSTAGIIPNAFLLREQAFFRIANANMIAEIISTSVVIYLSYNIDPLHALSTKGPFSAASSFLVLWYFSNKTEFGRPVPGNKFTAIKPLLGFSGYQLGFNFINYFSRNLDNILVGKYMGAIALGVYDKAYQLMKYPLMLLTFAMTPAIQPYLRKYAGDPKSVELLHSDFGFKLSIAGAIVGVTVFSTAEIIVSILLGDQWVEVIPIIRILAIGIPVQVILSTSGSFFQGMNRADWLFRTGVMSSFVMVAAIAFGVFMQDLIWLSWSVVIALHLNFFQAYYILYKKVFLIPVYNFLFKMMPAACVVAAMISYSCI